MMTDKKHAELIETYFDQHAQSWHDYYQNLSSLVNMVLIDRKNIALAFLDGRLPQGARVLDAGCGAGIAAIELARKGHSVEGVDIAEKMIAIAGNNLANSGLPGGRCSFRVGNVLEEPAPSEGERFDCVLALGFIQYQQDETASLKKLAGLLKPGGLLVVSGPVKAKLTQYFGVLNFLERKAGPVPGHELLETISVNDYSPGRFRKLLEGSGFTFLQFRGHGFTGFKFLAPRMKLRSQVRLHRLFTRLARILPIQPYANDLVVLARKLG